MKSLPISVRLLLSYLLVAVLPLAGLATLYLASFDGLLRDTMLANIAAIADKKTEQIQSHVDERITDARVLSQRVAVTDGAHALGRAFRAEGLDSAAYRAAEANLRLVLQSTNVADDFYDLLLIDPEGNIVFSLLRETALGTNLVDGPYRGTHLARGYEAVMQEREPHLTRVARFAPADHREAIYILAPIFGNGALAGALVLQLDTTRLETVTSSATGLGRTGEAVLAQAGNGRVLYTAPLRHVEDAAYRHSVPIEKASLPMQQAVDGLSGEGVVRDYAGRETVAAWRHLPTLGWGMVVKMDVEEALAPVTTLRQLTYAALSLFLVLSGTMAYFLGRRLSDPLHQLTRVADRVAAGDLSQRVALDGVDEMGRLARAFNHMTGALRHARDNLEAQVEERSKALREVTTLQNAILDEAGALVVVLDREGRIRRFNRACETLSQYRFEEVEGRFVWDILLAPEERDSVRREAFENNARNPHALRASHTNHWIAKDGSRRLIEWSISVLRDDAGQMEFMVGIGNDITDRKHAEDALKQSEHRLNEAQRIARIGSWELDLEHDRLLWSDETYKLFELDPEAFCGTYEAFLAAIHPADRARVDEAYTRSLSTRTPYDIVHRLCMPDGRIKWVNERCETVYDERGRPLRSIGTIQDITDRKLAEEAIHLYAKVFEHSGEGILITDSERRILAVNPTFTRLTGYALDDIKGQNPRILASGATPDETYRAIWAALESDGYWQGEVIDRRKDGTTYPQWMSISAVSDDNGTLTHYIASFTDITARKEAEAQISQLAFHDTLTGLNNRFSLQTQLDQALTMARRERHALAVIFLDLDRFKGINDSMGHAAGDELLVNVAHRLRENVRSSDIVARLGGDEFVIVLTDVDAPTAAARLADKILHALTESFLIGESELHTSASVGIALYPNDGIDGDTLMKNADTAMYHAKSEGRNNVQFFTPEMNETAVERLLLDHDLRVAVQHRQLSLVYQPQVDCSDGSVVGVEALVRWNHPRRGVISPAVFIPVAEETGVILQLGEWVLDEACRQLRAWRDAGVAGVIMAVNLSAQQLRAPVLVEHVSKALQKHGLEGADLELEITESVAMHDPDASIRQLLALRALGVRLSIDDFGTGYSSLSYLKLLPINTLKLDQSFVRDIETDSNDVAICTATIALAHNLGLTVIAEGVETQAQQLLLDLHHCDYMQGYFFSAPLPPDGALAFIRARNATETSSV